MRITKRRTGARTYEIKADGELIGGAHEANVGPVWWVRAETLGIAWRHSGAERNKYRTVESAANDAVAYARRAAKQAKS